MQNSPISLLWLVAANLDLSPDVTQTGAQSTQESEKNDSHLSPASGTYTNETLSCEFGKYDEY